MITLLWVTCWIARRMCGLRTMGKWFNLGIPLVILVLGIITHYAAVDDSEEERSIIVRNRLTFQVSGRVRRVDKNGFGLQRLVASGVGVRTAMCRHSLIPSWLVPLGRLPQRTAPTNPTYSSQRQNSKPVPPNFPPLNQPLLVGLVDAAASGSVPAFPAGNLDWLVAFL